LNTSPAGAEANPGGQQGGEFMEVQVRDAATLMLLRDVGCLQVLLLRRNLSSGFVPGVHLFPGGAVDDEDFELARRLAKSPAPPSDEEASSLLGLPERGIAFFVAAVRECFEEAGILLACRRGGKPIDFGSPTEEERFVAHRRRLTDGLMTFAALCEAEELELEVGRLRYLSRWVTPEGSPRRYDTRFFVASLPGDQQALHDDIEVIESLWLGPATAIQRHQRGEMELVFPTRKSLEWLARFSTSEEALVAAGQR
jgi:8-oxo-dGTP pyrophosphatase MutT (NUDIX family)